MSDCELCLANKTIGNLRETLAGWKRTAKNNLDEYERLKAELARTNSELTATTLDLSETTSSNKLLRSDVRQVEADNDRLQAELTETQKQRDGWHKELHKTTVDFDIVKAELADAKERRLETIAMCDQLRAELARTNSELTATKLDLSEATDGPATACAKKFGIEAVEKATGYKFTGAPDLDPCSIEPGSGANDTDEPPDDDADPLTSTEREIHPVSDNVRYLMGDVLKGPAKMNENVIQSNTGTVWCQTSGCYAHAEKGKYKCANHADSGLYVEAVKNGMGEGLSRDDQAKWLHRVVADKNDAQQTLAAVRATAENLSTNLELERQRSSDIEQTYNACMKTIDRLRAELAEANAKLVNASDAVLASAPTDTLTAMHMAGYEEGLAAASPSAVRDGGRTMINWPIRQDNSCKRNIKDTDRNIIGYVITGAQCKELVAAANCGHDLRHATATSTCVEAEIKRLQSSLKIRQESNDWLKAELKRSHELRRKQDAELTDLRSRPADTLDLLLEIRDAVMAPVDAASLAPVVAELVAMTKRAEAAEAREPDWIAMNGDHADYLRVQRSGPDWLVWDTFGQKAGQAICIGSDPDFALAVEAACRFLEKD